MSENGKSILDYLPSLFISLLVFLLLFIPTYYLIPNNILFKSTFSGIGTNYGFIVSTIFIVGILLQVATNINSQNLPEKIVKTLGFRKNWKQIIIGLTLGTLVGILTWYIRKDVLSAILISPRTALNTLIFAPVFEELLYRGYLINQGLRINKSLKMEMLIILSSVSMFAWSHANFPELKLISGTAYAGIYLWSWKNNMTAAIMAHFGTNAAVLFLSLKSSGIVGMAVALIFEGIAFVILIWLIWNAYSITNGITKIYRKFMSSEQQ